MINNCYIDAASIQATSKQDEASTDANVDYYNLTNDAYVLLIDELLKAYITNFEESFANMTIDEFLFSAETSSEEASQISSSTEALSLKLSEAKDVHIQIEGQPFADRHLC